MHTLLEFLSITKGTEYIIAIIFLLVFIAFWKLFNIKNTTKDSNIEEIGQL